MPLFLDSADPADWIDLMPTGLFYGITTNPLLAQRAGRSYRGLDFRATALTALDLGAKEVHFQVFGENSGYVACAERYLAAGGDDIRVCVKIPLTDAGIRAVPAIKALGAPVLMTACYDAKQMLVAQALGATYIAPYVGRMIEAGIDAAAHLAQMRAIAATAAAPTSIMLASLRSVDQLLGFAAAGHDTFTISPAIARALLSDPMTEAAVAAFEIAAAE